MELTGDPQGIEALKKIKDTNATYLKFLLQEVQTSFEGTVPFKAADGTEYKLVRDAKVKGKLIVEKV
ncbi:MAG: hypothetical protein AB1405_02575 [Bdellovibrionota bacterium]